MPATVLILTDTRMPGQTEGLGLASFVQRQDRRIRIANSLERHLYADVWLEVTFVASSGSTPTRFNSASSSPSSHFLYIKRSARSDHRGFLKVAGLLCS